MNNAFTARDICSWRPAVCISMSLLLVLLLGGWGAFQDRAYARQTILRSEITRIRSHAERTARGLAREMSKADGPRNLRDASKLPWLREHWDRFIPPPDSIHGAVVDQQGMILAHSDPLREGGVLCADWNSEPISEAGVDVYSTCCRSLTGGPWTFDIFVPIQVNGDMVGAYHVGASQEWINLQIAAARRRSDLGWGFVIGGIIVVVLLSSLSLYQITRRSVVLEDALRQSHTNRLAELNYLMIGLAHEVRNPLNAVRLNLFTADRVFRGDVGLDGEEVSTMLAESVREIERVDSLMTLLLGYARADDSEIVTIDVFREILAIVQFLTPTFQSRGVALVFNACESNDYLTRTGRGQVRQVLLNLLNNARDAVLDQTGRIHIELVRNANSIEVTISDNGQGIRQEHRERLFSPFFSTKEQGTGLGLALVRSLVERAGGYAECCNPRPGNCQFRVTWIACRDHDSWKRTA